MEIRWRDHNIGRGLGMWGLCIAPGLSVVGSRRVPSDILLVRYGMLAWQIVLEWLLVVIFVSFAWFRAGDRW